MRYDSGVTESGADDARDSDITGIVVVPSGPAGPQTPPPFIEASLEILRGEGTGKRFELTAPETVLGRGDDVAVHLDDPVMSRRHALVTYVQNEFRIKDLESANGTFLNGSRVTEYALHNGDKVLMGETLLLFSVRSRD